MTFQFPETTEQRKAGMAAMRAQMLAAKKRALDNQKLKPADRKAIESDIALIEKIQRERGEI